MKTWLTRQWNNFCLTAADDQWEAAMIAGGVMGGIALVLTFLVWLPGSTLVACAGAGVFWAFIRYAAHKGAEK